MALLLCAALHAQTTAPTATPPVTNPNQGAAAVINIPRLDSAPKLEDFLDMKPGPGVAQQMAKVEGFIQLDSKEGAPAQERTEVYLGYDAKNLLRGLGVLRALAGEPALLRQQTLTRKIQGRLSQEATLKGLPGIRTPAWSPRATASSTTAASSS